MNIYMRYPQGKTKALTLSYDDGVYQDTELVNLMVKYGIKGTFNINTGMFTPDDAEHPTNTRTWRMSAKMCYYLYSNNGMEVAVHAVSHPHLETLSGHLLFMGGFKRQTNIRRAFWKTNTWYGIPIWDI